MGRIGRLLKKGRIVIALVVAFALGGGAGGLVEHQRLKDKSNKSASTQTTTSPTTTRAGTPVAAAWFKTPTTAACPALKVWKSSGAAAYLALLKRGTWSTTQTTLLAQNTAATASLKTLLPMTTRVGHAGVNFLVTMEGKTSDALKHASSQATYATAAKALASPRLTRSNGIMTRAAKACGTTT